MVKSHFIEAEERVQNDFCYKTDLKHVEPVLGYTIMMGKIDFKTWEYETKSSSFLAREMWENTFCNLSKRHL